MKTLFSLLLLSFSLVANADTLRGKNSQWLCSAFDKANQQWMVKSSYLRKALNQAHQNCRQESQEPSSCQVAKEHCEMVFKGRRTFSNWTCMSLDRLGRHWVSDLHRTRNDAIIGARQICKAHSTFPSSCYVRPMTCEKKT